MASNSPFKVDFSSTVKLPLKELSPPTDKLLDKVVFPTTPNVSPIVALEVVSKVLVVVFSPTVKFLENSTSPATIRVLEIVVGPRSVVVPATERELSNVALPFKTVEPTTDNALSSKTFPATFKVDCKVAAPARLSAPPIQTSLEIPAPPPSIKAPVVMEVALVSFEIFTTSVNVFIPAILWLPAVIIPPVESLATGKVNITGFLPEFGPKKYLKRGVLFEPSISFSSATYSIALI